MGQAYGKPQVHPDVKPFTNLPKEAIQSIWTSYNLHGEGWGLDIEDFKTIFANADYFMSLGFTTDQLGSLFEAIDNDGNGLVDALESIIAIVLASGMESNDKINFIFNAYDFNVTGELSSDEALLLFRSIVKGLTKLCPAQTESLFGVSDIATILDEKVNEYVEFACSTDKGTLTLSSLQKYTSYHPVVSSWLEFCTQFPSSGSEESKESSDLSSFASLSLSDESASIKTAWVPVTDFAGLPKKEEIVIPVTDIPAVEENNEDDAPAEEEKEDGEEEGEVAPPAFESKILPWTSTADLMKPEAEALPPRRADIPEDAFELAWVHGYSGSEGKADTAAYTGASGNTIVYSAANYIVQMIPSMPEEGGEEGEAPPVTWSQQAYRDHNYPITALSVSKDKLLFASADVVTDSTQNKESKIVVWDSATSTAQGLISLGSEAGDGVRMLSFSHNSQYLLALSNNKKNTLTIYDVATRKPVFVVNHGDHEIITSIKFCGTAAMFCCVGTTGITMYIDEGRGFLPSLSYRDYKSRPGVSSTANGASGIGTAVCNFEYEDETVTATSDGYVLFWHGRNCIQSLKVHTGAITSLHYDENAKKVVAGTDDGFVFAFQLGSGASKSTSVAKAGPRKVSVRQLEQCLNFDIGHIGSASRKITSLKLHTSGDRVLVGVNSGDLYELSLKAVLPPAAEEVEGGGDAEAAPEGEAKEGEEGAATESISKPIYGTVLHGGPLINSHWGNLGNSLSINGMCPSGPEGFITCGADGSVRLWSAPLEGGAHKQTNSTVCDGSAVCVAANAGMVAVGLSGVKEGTIELFSLPDFRFIASLKDSDDAVKMLKWAPDGTTLYSIQNNADGTTSTLRTYIESPPPEGAEEGAGPTWGVKETLQIDGIPNSIDYASEGNIMRVTDSLSDSIAFYQIQATEDIPFGTVLSFDNIKAFGPGLTFSSTTTPLTWDTKGVFASLKSMYEHLLPSNIKPEVPPVEGEEGADEESKANEEKKEEGEGEEEAKTEDTCPPMAALLGSFARSQHLMLSTGTTGTITLTRVPAYDNLEDELSVGQSAFYAHCCDVSCMTFLGEGGERLVTAGRSDGLIIVWNVKYDLSEQEVEPADEIVEDGEEEGGATEDLAGYDSAEEEDLFDGERLLVHLTATTKTEEEDSAVKEWLQYANREKDEMQASTETIPNDELTLDWVYGYSARSTRNSVKYDAEGRIIYPAGSVAVIHDKSITEESKRQSFCMAHHDEITCIDVHMNSGLAASGQKGNGVLKVAVWNTSTKQIVHQLDCGAVRAISAVAFSSDGNYLVAACCDDEHTIKLFDLRGGVLRTSTPGGSEKVLSLCFSNSSTIKILQAGVNHFRIHTYNGLDLVTKIGKWNGNKKSVITCCKPLPLAAEGGFEFIMCLPTGSLAVVNRDEVSIAQCIPGLNNEPVTAMDTILVKEATAEEPPMFNVIIGGGNSMIKMLQGMELEPILEIDLKKNWGPEKDKEYGLIPKANTRGFRSLCVDKSKRKIVYGTSGGEIGEIDLETKSDVNTGPIVYSHFKDCLGALQSHPLRQECLTAGDDYTLRVWDLETKKQMTYVMLPDVARCAAYAPNGQVIAAGLGGEVRGEARTIPRNMDGKIAIVSFLQNELRIVTLIGDANDSINCLCFSPDGARLYAGSGDSNIYIYDAFDNFKLMNTLKVHGSSVIALDISTDGLYMISCAADGEILTWDCTLNSPSSFDNNLWRELKWFIRTTTQGYNSTGVFDAYSPLSTIKTVTESNDGKLIVTGDAHGRVSMYSNPAVALGAPSKKYYGHSMGGISRVAFTVDDNFLLSTGFDDRCLFQWKVEKSPVIAATKSVNITATEQAAIESLGNFAETFVVKSQGASVDVNQFSKAPPVDSAAAIPTATLQSIIGTGSSSSAYYCGLGNVVKVIGKKLVCYDANRLDQIYWSRQDESSNVGSLTVSKDNRFIAVGTESGVISIINGSNGKNVSILSSSVAGGVKTADFSYDNKTLVVLGGNSRNQIMIFTTLNGEWADATLIYSGDSSSTTIDYLKCTDSTAYNFVTIDEAQSIKWWAINGRNLSSITITIPVPEGAKATTVTSLISIPGGQFITGNALGELILYKGSTDASSIIGKHEGAIQVDDAGKSGNAIVPITACTTTTTSTFISAGGSDIKVWTYSTENNSYECNRCILLSDITSGLASSAYLEDTPGGCITTGMATDTNGDRILICLSSNAIVEVATDTGAAYVVDEGELSIEASCIAAHPTEPNTVAVAMSNGVVKLWDISYTRREVVGSLSMDKKLPSAMCFVSDTQLAVSIDRSDTGGKSGAIMIVDLSAPDDSDADAPGRKRKGVYRKMKITKKLHNIGKGCLRSMKMMPNGKYMAAGSEDGSVYFFQVDKDFEQYGSFSAISACAITNFDFATDESTIRVFGPNLAGDAMIKSAYFTLNMSNVDEMAFALKEEEDLKRLTEVPGWASASCPASVEVKGVHPACQAGMGAPVGEIADASKSAQCSKVASVSAQGSKFVAASYADGSAKVFR